MRHFFFRLSGALIGLFFGLIIGVLLLNLWGGPILEVLQPFEELEAFEFVVLLPLCGLTGAILGANMIGADWRFNLGVVGVLLALAGVFVLANKDAFFPPPKVEHLGNFELLTYH